ncbi:enoyl-CoA hydratase [Novosphingobium fuchskuhlense]|uniref:Enoyl-CoA hydratase n=1 Tax=Novosphingobium fuchskuhlense TaxID=1117702 RepID=A0A117UVW8_9SPHN|nr:enoyl-CoA hydratase-related protein [Novosphingobium fuchskuhlense]KUR71859.1 enoyl-CoA hydratase [Novosphingobium fuchskuhlense]
MEDAPSSLVLIDTPQAGVRRLTLNRPEKRNALSNALRAELFAALEAADKDADVRVIILRGAGSCFSAGYDLSPESSRQAPPYHTAGGAGFWPRHVVEGVFRIWDLATPVIAQVHGWCLAGATELATACDLIYLSDDAQIGYPPVRGMSPPDTQFHPWLCGFRSAMEQMLTGDALSAHEAVRVGFANRAYPLEVLEAEVLKIAERVAKIPPEVQQINKRSVHRAMEAMGLRTALRAGTEMQALAMTTEASRQTFAGFRAGDVRGALDARDGVFGDYRTSIPDSVD